jgi:hypothetical protein
MKIPMMKVQEEKSSLFFAAIDLLSLMGQSGDIFIAFFNLLGYA